MKRNAVARLSVLLATSISFFVTACGGGGSSSSASTLNLAGNWTVSTVSTQGHGNASGTAPITQSGEGLGANGTTDLVASIGQVALSQTGTALTGTIKTSFTPLTFSFTGTLSGGNFTVTGETACGPNLNESATLTGTITSSSVQGTYKLNRPTGCFYQSDAGTFSGTKK